MTNSNLINSNDFKGRTKVKASLLITLSAAFAITAIPSAANAENETREGSSTSMFSGTKAAKPKKRLRQKSTRKVYLGKASYICSPSGFGRTSKCRLRSKYN